MVWLLFLCVREVRGMMQLLAAINGAVWGPLGVGLLAAAGLFALYALYGTDVFSRAASVSGSLWFPGFREYVFSHEPKRRPDRVYFSVGDRESRTKNPVLQTVQENTEAICGYYREMGICTTFRLNPGGHHERPAQRTAAGIQWLSIG